MYGFLYVSNLFHKFIGYVHRIHHDISYIRDVAAVDEYIMVFCNSYNIYLTSRDSASSSWDPQFLSKVKFNYDKKYYYKCRALAALKGPILYYSSPDYLFRGKRGGRGG